MQSLLWIAFSTKADSGICELPNCGNGCVDLTIHIPGRWQLWAAGAAALAMQVAQGILPFCFWGGLQVLKSSQLRKSRNL